MPHSFNGVICYIAGPYRAKTTELVEQNIKVARYHGLDLVQLGIMPLIPHCNTALMEDLNTPEYFLEGTMELMRRCDAVYVIPNYQSSQGTLGEIAEAQRLGKPVFYSLQDLQTWLQAQ